MNSSRLKTLTFSILHPKMFREKFLNFKRYFIILLIERIVLYNVIENFF